MTGLEQADRKPLLPLPAYADVVQKSEVPTNMVDGSHKTRLST